MTDWWPFKERTPYAVQTEALQRSLNQPKYGYYMEQGLGKTATLFADYLRMLLHETVQGLVVLMPSYLKGNWYDEAVEVGIDKRIELIRVWPDKNCRDLFDAGHKPFILLVNFEALLHSGGDFVEDVLRQFPCLLAVDEPSPMRNGTTATAKHIMKLAQHCEQRRLTYGTPDPESSKDLYLQLRFLGEINGWNPYAFRNRFCTMGGYMGKQVMGRKNEEELARIVDRCAFRALKEDWWDDAPEKIYTWREIEMTATQQKHYKRMEKEFYTFVGNHINELDVYAEQIINVLQKLQQIARGFIIDNTGAVHDIVDPGNNPAIRVVRETLEQTRGKMILFTIHTHALNTLETQLAKLKPAVLRGGMTREAIDAEKHRFNNDPDCKLIMGMEQVMAKGHTLLGQSGDQRCSTTMFYENSYSGELRLHAEDRNHRFGQDRAVTYIDMVASPNDMKVIKALQRKKKLTLALAEIIRGLHATAK